LNNAISFDNTILDHFSNPAPSFQERKVAGAVCVTIRSAQSRLL
jgi:hypothetical protein